MDVPRVLTRVYIILLLFSSSMLVSFKSFQSNLCSSMFLYKQELVSYAQLFSSLSLSLSLPQEFWHITVFTPFHLWLAFTISLIVSWYLACNSVSVSLCLCFSVSISLSLSLYLYLSLYICLFILFFSHVFFSLPSFLILPFSLYNLFPPPRLFLAFPNFIPLQII